MRPISRGGFHNEDNMQILCRSCNAKKHNSIDINQYFIIDESPEYIKIRDDFPINGFRNDEFKAIIDMKFQENYKIFSGDN